MFVGHRTERCVNLLVDAGVRSASYLDLKVSLPTLCKTVVTLTAEWRAELFLSSLDSRYAGYQLQRGQGHDLDTQRTECSSSLRLV